MIIWCPSWFQTFADRCRWSLENALSSLESTTHNLRIISLWQMACVRFLLLQTCANDTLFRCPQTIEQHFLLLLVRHLIPMECGICSVKLVIIINFFFRFYFVNIRRSRRAYDFVFASNVKCLTQFSTVGDAEYLVNLKPQVAQNHHMND